ncbi:hypothetical protein [Granulicella sp. S156]|uniref:hypothetical protein n=1 Tax=Granulicella sp. S156 TaxID=1747224 RepID=UPI00131B8473|nr:hypothetical protein [Granulicella sp. S156]
MPMRWLFISSSSKRRLLDDGQQAAPRFGYFGDDVEPNNVKRILTKSGNRIQIVDNEGQETITVATPGKTKISLTEKNGQTNQPLISFESSGDIHFVAANRISFKSKFFSREIG